MPDVRLAVALLALASLLAIGRPEGAAAATVLEPMDGLAYTGVSTPGAGAPFDSFLAVSQQDAVSLYGRFTSHDLGRFDWLFDEFRGRPVVGVVSWWMFTGTYSPGTPGGTSASIARGDIDAYILARAAEVRAYGKPVFLRINWEMNGRWFPWSVYDSSGNAKPENSHADFRDAWRRAVVLFRGGTRVEIAARLSAIGLPGLTTADTSVPPTTQVAWVWAPNYGSSFPSKDSVHSYYPGDAYVDWVGVDWYGWGSGDVGHHGQQAAAAGGPNELYDRYSGPASTGKKPFMLPEWGVYGVDRPAWTADMFAWMAVRPKVKAQLYFNYPAANEDSSLESFPGSASVFRGGVAGARWVRDHLQVKTFEAPPPPPPSPLPFPPPPPPPPEPSPEPLPADTTGPTIVLSSPATGQTLSGTVVVAPSISDASGVASVRFLLDGVSKRTDSAPGTVWSFEVGALSAGDHTLGVEALDTLGQSTTLVVPFKVAAARRGKRPGARTATGTGVSAHAATTNERIAREALRRVGALERALGVVGAPDGARTTLRIRPARPTLRELRITRRHAAEALRRVRALETIVLGRSDPAVQRMGVVRLSAAELKGTRRMALDALARARALEAITSR